MDTRILVTYATKYGATAEIAEKIGQVILQAGLPTDILPTDRVSDLAPYEAIVLGSAVYVGQWRKEAASFLEANEKTMAKAAGMVLFQRPHGHRGSGSTDAGLALPRSAATHRRPH
ncbi:MAG: flavodoxin domain-containing protein [Anaerolineales bacterium]|jgi:menaquinone-dependent protoporphyrinogen oxidase|nr:flavodoxin domain-containing protein [Anaerolineales bacterium]